MLYWPQIPIGSGCSPDSTPTRDNGAKNDSDPGKSRKIASMKARHSCRHLWVRMRSGGTPVLGRDDDSDLNNQSRPRAEYLYMI